MSVLRHLIIGVGLASPLTAADLRYPLFDALGDSLLGHCGCTSIGIDTGWDVDHLGGERVKPWAIGLRYDSLDQDRMLSGRREVELAPGTSAGIEHRIVSLDVDYNISPAWSVGVTVPWVDRRQDDLLEDEDDPTNRVEEHSHPRGLGDIRAEARYIVDVGMAQRAGIIVGLKLPTGSTSEETTRNTYNSQGALIDSSVEQVTWTVNPGNGATDAILGGLWRHDVHTHRLAFFARLQAQFAVAHQEEFRPGNRYSLNLGTRYQVHRFVSVNLQVTGLASRRDTGERAEVDESGGEFVTISPGVAFYPTADWQVFGNYLWPAYSRVNGEQLVVSTGWSAGTAVRF
jgi:hypothetical protein